MLGLPLSSLILLATNPLPISNTNMVEFDDVRAAAARIKGIVKNTPVKTSSALDELAGRKLYFKCENLQHIQAFKFRGASNALALVLEQQDNDDVSDGGEEEKKNDVKRSGICTHSSGNHAQAVAKAAKQRNIPAYIVMPSTAPKVKVKGVRDNEGEIIFCEPTLQARETTTAEVMERTGATFIHPFNDERVIAGQGTASLELIEEIGTLDAVLTPVGGGGLLSGTCISTNALLPQARIFASEPKGADDAYRSLESGKLIPQTGPDTICDGLLTSLAPLTFEIISNHVEKIITVTDEEVIHAMALIRDHLDMIVEPSAATTLAAVLHDDFRSLDGINSVGLVLTGGNVDPEKVEKWI